MYIKEYYRRLPHRKFVHPFHANIIDDFFKYIYMTTPQAFMYLSLISMTKYLPSDWLISLNT